MHVDARDLPDGAYAWRRLAVSLVIGTIGGVGVWSAVVALPVIQAEFGLDRGGASIPYTATMVGFALGGVGMGRLADRFGIRVPLMLGATMLAVGYMIAAAAQSYLQFVLAQALLIGMLGSSASFGPLVADVSRWFVRRRGIAVAIAASGSYLAGTIWPPLLHEGFVLLGWRMTHLLLGLFCLTTMLPLTFLLRRRPTFDAVPTASDRSPAQPSTPLPLLQPLLVLAGFACCMAMSMPQASPASTSRG